MEIKCNKCNKVPKIEIFDKIQSIRFICDDSFSHFGMLSINNFYKNLVVNNYEANIKEFISNYKKNTNNINHNTSLYYFIKFQEEFESLLNELKAQYQDLIEQLNKILFIKNEFFNKNENTNYSQFNEDNNIYLNKEIIEMLRELVSFVKERKIIKEKYPKIIKNEEMTNEIKKILSQNLGKEDSKKYITDFEFYNYTFNKSSINIKNIKEFHHIDYLDFTIGKKLMLLNDKLNPAKILYFYSLINANYMNFYDSNLQNLFTINVPERIYNIYQIKEGPIILTGPKINIINVDIANKKYKISQIIDFNCIENDIHILEIYYDNRVSILMCFGEDIIFYLMKDNLKSNEFIKINIDSAPIKARKLFSFHNNNIINTTFDQVDLYIIKHFYDENNNFQMKIENNGSIMINEILNSGIYFIDEDKFVVSGRHKLFLISLSEKEIISIYEERFEIINIFSGFNGELYLFLNFNYTFDYNSKYVLKQINFDDHGIFEIGYNFMGKINRLEINLIDLGNDIYYI